LNKHPRAVRAKAGSITAALEPDAGFVAKRASGSPDRTARAPVRSLSVRRVNENAENGIVGLKSAVMNRSQPQ
jgi:hypothetical protein